MKKRKTEKNENEKLVELLENHKMFRESFYNYFDSYQELLNQMDPEKVDELAGKEYLQLVTKITQTHNTIVYELKHSINANKDLLNEYFEWLHSSPENVKKYGETISFGPFISIKYDQDQKNTYLEYATDEEMHDIYYAGVDNAIRQQWYIETLGIPQEHADKMALGEAVAYSAPIIGTGMDIKDAAKNFYRGNIKEGFISSAWSIIGIASDLLIILPEPVVTKAAGAGIRAARGARAAKKIGTGIKAVSAGKKVAKFTRGTGKIKETLEKIKNANRAFFDRKIWNNPGISNGVKSGINKARMHAWKIQIGLGASDAYRQITGTQPSGKFFAGDKIAYESSNSANNGSLPPGDFMKLPEAAQQSENPETMMDNHRNKIEQLKGEMNWSQLMYKIQSPAEIKIYREDCGESIVLKQDKNTLRWTLEGLGESYDSVYQAAAMANLLNHTAHIIKSNGYEGDGKKPFHFDDGNLDFDRNWNPVDLTLFTAGSAWLHFFYSKLNISPGQITSLFNNWYQRKM